MSAIFIHSGYLKAIAPAATMAMMNRYGLPLPGAAYAVALIIELGFGILFLIGFKARLIGLLTGCGKSLQRMHCTQFSYPRTAR